MAFQKNTEVELDLAPRLPEIDRGGLDVEADRGSVGVVEHILGKPAHERRLADAGVADHDDLETGHDIDRRGGRHRA